MRVLFFLCLLTTNSLVYAQATVGDSPVESDSHISQFPQDLVQNLSSLFSIENLFPATIGSVAVISTYQFDHEVQNYFLLRDRFGALDKTATFIGGAYVITGAAGMMFAVGQISNNGEFREMTYALAQGLVINSGITLAAKTISDRQRPDGSNAFSFPSGHTSNSFVIATVLNRFYGAKAGIPAYAVAALIGTSRISENAHYLSDVIAGAALGYIVGRTISRPTNHPPKYLLTPAFSPSGDGVGLALYLRF